LAYREIDWDAALVAAIPRIREAKTTQEYRSAVQGLLDALGDPVTRVLDVEPVDFGYVDLTLLAPTEVDSMFEKVKDTRGLIFDMRGYPQGTAWSIAPRINMRHAKTGAQFRRSQLGAFSAEEGQAGFNSLSRCPSCRQGKPCNRRHRDAHRRPRDQSGRTQRALL
jgi:hypothetical protein